MQKYIAQHISQDTGQPNGARRMLFGPESVYLAKDMDAALAAERQANTELAMRERKAEADLADAQHALILAKNNANSFRRVAEQRQGEIERLQRAVEWCLSNHAGHLYEQQNWNDNSKRYEYAWTIQVGSGNQVPEEFQDLIKARETTTGASNG